MVCKGLNTFIPFTACACFSTYSQHSREILERILSAASDSEVVQFLCCVCHIPHETSCQFKLLDPSLLFSCTGNPPTLAVTRSAKAQELDIMEASGLCVVKLLQTSLRSRQLTGQFFNDCMSRLATILREDAKLEVDCFSDRSKSLDSCSPSSSALLECERAMPKSSLEVLSDAGTLYITAALCEHCSEVVLRETHLPSVLRACKTIIECHAAAVSQDRNTSKVRLIPGRSSRVEVTGGQVTLSICFGLVSAILGGAKTVSSGIF